VIGNEGGEERPVCQRATRVLTSLSGAWDWKATAIISGRDGVYARDNQLDTPGKRVTRHGDRLQHGQALVATFKVKDGKGKV
jgi:hypothetical protein